MRVFTVSQQTASVITKERLEDDPKKIAIHTDENSFLNSPKAFEKMLLINARMCLG